MKIMKSFNLVVFCCLSVLVSQGVPGDKKPDGYAHIRIVDTTGAPVEGAVVTVKHDRTQFKYPQFKYPVTDADGRIAVDFGDGTGKPWGCTVKGVKRVGYDCREEDFSERLLEFYAWSDKNSYDNPTVIVIRKMEPEPAAIRWGAEWYIDVNSDSCRPHQLSIFDPYSYPKPKHGWSSRTVLGNANEGGLGQDLDKSGYVDIFVQPRCDRVREEWVLSLWTTNVNSGIIATTNRVYVAPENGYCQRVDVAKSDYQSPTFTLYLKTRPQGLYVMLPFREGEIRSSYGPAARFVYFTLRCPLMFVNPYGERNLERDVRYWHDDENMFVAKGTDIFDVLKAGKIPPRMDIPARVANRRRYWAAMRKASEHEQINYRRRLKKAEILKQLEGQPQHEIDRALEPIEQERKRSHKILRELAEERNRLNEELPTLNLPPGMTEKDKYGKVDMSLSIFD